MRALALKLFHRYTLMMSCWQQDSKKRPTFSQIVELLDSDLEDLAGYMNMDCLFPEMKCPSKDVVKKKATKKRSNSLATDTLKEMLQPPTTERQLGVSFTVTSPDRFL